MEIKFSNNASTLLLDNIDASATTLYVLPDTGDLFPELRNPSDYFKITLVDPGDGSYEIMHVVSTLGDQFTVERGKENTVAKPFPQNSIVENRLTAGSIEHILNDVAASSTNEGRIRIATEAEVNAGVVDNAALVPAYATSLYVPVGLIAPYHGQVTADGFVIDAATSKVRFDWHLCDGTEGTPDLRGRMVIGADSDHALNTKGGSWTTESQITVDPTTLTEAQMPSHRHGVGPFSGVNHGQVMAEPWEGHKEASSVSGYTGGGQSHTHSATSTVNVANPYYVLAYIKKIS